MPLHQKGVGVGGFTIYLIEIKLLKGNFLSGYENLICSDTFAFCMSFLPYCVFIAHQGSMKHRKVKHYGYEFNYDTNNINKDCPLEEPLPDLLVDMIDKVMQTGHVTKKLNQVTVNQYLPGQGMVD